jgi:hypothetical protein
MPSTSLELLGEKTNSFPSLWHTTTDTAPLRPLLRTVGDGQRERVSRRTHSRIEDAPPGKRSIAEDRREAILGSSQHLGSLVSEDAGCYASPRRQGRENTRSFFMRRLLTVSLAFTTVRARLSRRDREGPAHSQRHIHQQRRRSPGGQPLARRERHDTSESQHQHWSMQPLGHLPPHS